MLPAFQSAFLIGSNLIAHDCGLALAAPRAHAPRRARAQAPTLASSKGRYRCCAATATRFRPALLCGMAEPFRQRTDFRRCAQPVVIHEHRYAVGGMLLELEVEEKHTLPAMEWESAEAGAVRRSSKGR